VITSGGEELLGWEVAEACAGPRSELGLDRPEEPATLEDADGPRRGVCVVVTRDAGEPLAGREHIEPRRRFVRLEEEGAGGLRIRRDLALARRDGERITAERAHLARRSRERDGPLEISSVHRDPREPEADVWIAGRELLGAREDLARARVLAQTSQRLRVEEGDDPVRGVCVGEHAEATPRLAITSQADEPIEPVEFCTLLGGEGRGGHRGRADHIARAAARRHAPVKSGSSRSWPLEP
jgi:hypothetical protein